MLVEVDSKGETHPERSNLTTSRAAVPCTAWDKFHQHVLFHGPRTASQPCDPILSRLSHDSCSNCGWRPDHVQERGAEIVVHMDWEERDVKWYDKNTPWLSSLEGVYLWPCV